MLTVPTELGLPVKAPAETFAKFPSVLRANDRSDRNPRYRAVIGGFRFDLSITRKDDGKFGNVSAVVLFSKVAYQRKRW